MRILHIHSDWKFVKGSLTAFNNPEIENKVFYIGDSIINDGTIVSMPFSDNNANIIASEALAFDIVVFYSMRLEHALICNKLDKRIIVLWRFFGDELYSLMGQTMLSPESRRFYKKSQIHHLLSIVKNSILYSTSAEKAFQKAVKRSDYFCGLSDTEYIYLRNHFNNLPPFVQLPYWKFSHKEIVPKQDVIILGHSKNIYGNHLEVINRLLTSVGIDNYHYVMYFSYGQYSKEYSNAVLDLASKCPLIRVVSGFLDRDEYEKLTNSASAMVINSYREMGMGNVFYALRNGIKVYLSKNNVMYEWLLKEGFVVYTVDEFYNDIANRNVRLPEEQAVKNIYAYNNLTVKYSYEVFIRWLLSLNK